MKRPTRHLSAVPDRPRWGELGSTDSLAPDDSVSVPATRRTLLDRTEVLLVALFAAFMCVYQIGDYSFGGGDQTTHSLVVQHFAKGGNPLHPEYGGKPYYNKPPFKMWLAALGVRALGESNFSYRLVDGLCGVAIAVLLFLFVRRAFRSRLAAHLSVAALLGCNLFFFGHGVRNAVQDSMMILLVTAAIVFGWRVSERLIAQRSTPALPPSGEPDETAPLSQRGIYAAALFVGLLSGLAVLTKNVPGLLGLMILGIYAILTPSLRSQIGRLIIPGICAAIASLIPFGLFLAAQGDRFESAWGMMIRHELVKRATVGYHNRHAPFFYLEGLFHDGLTIPPILLSAALTYALIRFAMKRERAIGLLLIWAVVPVALFSTARSKLMWYVLPSVPALAALTGVALSTALLAAFGSGAASRGRGRRIVTGFAGTIGLVLLAYNIGLIAKKNLEPKKRLAVDMMVEDLLQAEERNGQTPPAVLKVVPARTAKHEDLYLGMLPQRGEVTVDTLPALLKQSVSTQPTLIAAPLSDLNAVAQSFRFRSYSLLAPIYRRRQWLTLFTDYPGAPRGMAPAAEEIDLSRLGARAMFGWKLPIEALGKRLAGSRGDSSGILLDGDIIRTTFGTDLEIFLASLVPAAAGTLTIDISLNGTPVAVFDGVREGFQIRAAHIAPEAWKRGSNALVLKYRRSDGRPIGLDDELVLAESLTLRVGNGRSLD